MSRRNYKALYTACASRQADSDQLIALLQASLEAERQYNKTIADALLMATAREQAQQQVIEELQQDNAQLQQHNALQAASLLQTSELIEKQEQIIAELNNTLTQQQVALNEGERIKDKLQAVTHELRLLKRQVMGRSSEKHLPTEDKNGEALPNAQLALNFEVETVGICRLDSIQHLSFKRQKTTTTPLKPGGRHRLPDLPKQIEEVYPGNIPAGAKCIGYEDKEMIACDPGHWYIRVIRRMVYMTVAQDEVTHKQLIAPLPPHPIPRCKLDISVLVMMVIDKYLYHMPLWRQRRRFLQYGVALPYSSLVHDVGKIADILEPLALLLLKEIIDSGLVQMDETGYLVLDNTKKKGKKSHRGFMWAMMNGVQRICCFIYQPGRGKKNIDDVLKGYKGLLHTDAYGAYTRYGQQSGVIHGKCASHIRRYFVQAMENDRHRATYVIEQFFAPLYAREALCKQEQMDYDTITEMRAQHAVPVLQAMRSWLERELHKVTPGSPIHKAISYALNHFEGLMVYTREAMYPFDNNDLEQQIRAIALGRNAHLFAGSHRGGEQAAALYSLLATCKLQGINPEHWLTDVLQRIPHQPNEKLIELLPQFWKPLHKPKANVATA